MSADSVGDEPSSVRTEELSKVSVGHLEKGFKKFTL